MGRHSALHGDAVHPVIAAALARRPADAPAGRHGQVRSDATESGLGWPGTSTTHEGLGWPGGMSDQDRAAVPDAEQRAAVPDAGHPEKPRGWRRLFRAA